MVSPVAYRITLPENWRIHNVLHVSRSRPWHETTEVRTKPAELPPPPLPVHDDKLGDFHAVERIIKKEPDAQAKRLKFLAQFDSSHNLKAKTTPRIAGCHGMTFRLTCGRLQQPCPPPNLNLMPTFEAVRIDAI